MRYATFGIVLLSILGGLVATAIIPHFISWIPYDYAIYMQGARMVRAGQDPHAQLPYWYPLPIVLFTTLPWSFLPDQFAWAFAFIPLGLLHLYYGRRAILWWLFFPLLINVAYAQAEGWLVLPLLWLIKDIPIKASIGTLMLMFKPAYGMLLVPYRLWQWTREHRRADWMILFGAGAVMFGAAFLVDPMWHLHWLDAVLRRGENPELIQRNMTIWSFVARGGIWLIVLAMIVVMLIWISVPLVRAKETRGDVLLALSLFIFPNGLNPVSSMMVIPLVETTTEILILIATSWIVAALDVLVGGFGGVYLLIVMVALLLRRQRLLARQGRGYDSG